MDKIKAGLTWLSNNVIMVLLGTIGVLVMLLRSSHDKVASLKVNDEVLTEEGKQQLMAAQLKIHEDDYNKTRNNYAQKLKDYNAKYGPIKPPEGSSG